MNYYNLLKRYNNEVIKPIQKVEEKLKDRFLNEVQCYPLSMQLKMLFLTAILEGLIASMYAFIGYLVYTVIFL